MTRLGTHCPAVLAPSLRSVQYCSRMVHASGTKVMRATNFELFKLFSLRHGTHQGRLFPLKTLEQDPLAAGPLPSLY